jgi:hypothetical protein
VTFDALFGTEGTSLKLQLLATEFLGLIVAKCPDNFLPSFGPILFSGIRKIIETSEASAGCLFLVDTKMWTFMVLFFPYEYVFRDTYQ